MTLDEMKSQRDALEEAINSGALQVKHGDKLVMYQAPKEMRVALRRLENKIKELETGKKPIRRRYAYSTGKGL